MAVVWGCQRIEGAIDPDINRNYLGLPEKFEIAKINQADTATMEEFIKAEISEKTHLERDFGIYASSSVYELVLEPEGLDNVSPELRSLEALMGLTFRQKWR